MNIKFPTTIETHIITHNCGIVDHYYYQIGDYEYHIGEYLYGSKLPAGTTKGAHIVARHLVCELCYSKFMVRLGESFETHRELFKFWYPFLNCETFCRFGISVQSIIALTGFVFTISLSIIKSWSLAIIAFLLALVFYLLYSKSNYSKCEKTKCPHIQQL